MLELENLRVRYGEVEALHGIGLKIAAGKVVALLGANGAGKTTALRAISGLQSPSTGDIRLAGQEITGLPPDKVAELGVGHVPQGRMVFPNQSVRDNLILGAYSLRHRPLEVAERMEREFHRFPRLRERAKQLAGTLSGGEQQMLVLSRCLMSNPRVMLLDEPSLGLAPVVVQQILETLQNLAREGMAVLLVEQMASAALAVSDHVSVLKMGSIEFSGTPGELQERKDLVRLYLGSTNA